MSTVLISLIIGISVARLWLIISRHFGILDDPRRAKVYKRDRIPTVQGVTLFVAFVLSVLATSRYAPLNEYILYMIAGATGLVIMSTIEVFIKISALIRLLLQFIIVGLVVWFGWLEMELIQLGQFTVEFGKPLGIIISFVRFILCINAINRFDGIEWQTSGVATIGYFTVWALIHYIIIPQFPDITTQNQVILSTVQHMSVICLVLSAIYTVLESRFSCLLRDAGTYFFGFTIAYLSLMWWAKVGTLIVVFSLVIFDAVWVIFYRFFIMKKNPLKGDLTHVHHRLLALWRSRGEVRMFVLIRSTSMAVLMLLQGTNSLNKLIIFAMMATIFFWINTYLYLIKKKNPEYQLDQRVKDILNDPVYRSAAN